MTAPSPVNYSNPVSTVTHQQYMRTVWDETKKVNPLLELADKKGVIETEENPGTYCEWKVKLGEFTADYRTDLAERTFARKNHYATASCGWSFIETTAALSERDLILNRNENAIVKLGDRIIQDLAKDFRKDVSRRFLTENAGSTTSVGQAAYAGGNLPIQGLTTLFHADSTPKTHSGTGTSATNLTATNSKRVQAVGDYCGLSKTPGGISGVDGIVADAWTPNLTNITYQWVSGTAGTWAADCVRIATHMMTELSYGNTAEDRPDLGLMTRDMYTAFKSILQDKQRLMIDDTPKSPDAGMYPRVHLPFEGAMFTFDEDQIAGLFSLINTDKLQIKVVPAGIKRASDGAFAGHTDELFNITTKHDIRQGADLAVATFITQMIAHPKYQGCAYSFI